jgi:hypothetical protein
MMGIGLGVGESGIGARAEPDAAFSDEPVIRVLGFDAPMVFPGSFIAMISLLRDVFFQCSTDISSAAQKTLMVKQSREMRMKCPNARQGKET